MRLLSPCATRKSRIGVALAGVELAALNFELGRDCAPSAPDGAGTCVAAVIHCEASAALRQQSAGGQKSTALSR